MMLAVVAPMSVRFDRALAMVVAFSLALLGGCVTVNIYFPAAAAEKVADKIIDDVWGADGKPGKAEEGAGSGDAPANGDQGADAGGSANIFERALGLALMSAVPTVQAAPDLDVSSPAIAQIQGRMSSRHRQLKGFYDAGVIGLDSRGSVAIRDLATLGLRDRATVKKLVSADNRDRAALYREIARANGHPEWEAKIRSTFARRWIARAHGGWWYKSGGAWKQK